MSQVKALENMIRRVIREEISEAVPAIAEYIVEQIQPARAAPSRSSSDGSSQSVKELLRNSVSWDPPGMSEGPSPNRGSQQIITVERGVDGHPPPPINEATKPVYEIINRDFSEVMKKLNLK